MEYEENMGVASDTQLAAWMQNIPDCAESTWSLKPTQDIPVLLNSPKTDEKRFDLAFWSMVPSWSDSLKLKYPTFNARSETATEKPTFKAHVKSHRCIIPVTGFYEWTGSKEKRVPHAIFGLEKVLPMAGLYSWWSDPSVAEGEGRRLTATILTRASAGVMESVHDRMPVFMDGSPVGDWLDPRIVGGQGLVDAISEASVAISADLHEYQVQPLRGNGPELILPAEISSFGSSS